jgi:hypothetical protein
MRRSTKISDSERSRRAAQRRASHHNEALAAIEPLIHPRSQAKRMLNCSVAKLIRLEKSGRLKAIKLDPESPSAMTYYTAEELHAVASGDVR